MALVAGIFKRFEHLAITPRAADVFGRTAAGRLDQARIEDVGFGRRHALDLDRVLPPVAVVVEITQRLGPGVFEHVDQARLAGVERSAGPVGRRLAPADVAGANLEEMAVRPAQRRLQRQVQPVELDVGGNLDSP